MTRNQCLTTRDLTNPCKRQHKGQKLVEPKQIVQYCPFEVKGSFKTGLKIRQVGDHFTL